MSILKIPISFITIEPGIKYFNPRYIKITVGDSINWINTDNEPHTLVYIKDGQMCEIPYYGTKIGHLEPNQNLFKKFDSYISRLDYSCALHPQETGIIIMYPTSQDNMTNTQTLRHLADVEDIPLPDILSHLRPTTSHRDVKKELIKFNPSETYPGVFMLEKYFDSPIYSILGNENLYKLQSKKLTIVFWDLTGFSDLCNRLIKEPLTISVFLSEYFEKAIEIIHKYNGIVDKFIGDGIMTYFGFDNQTSTDNFGEVNAIDAALEIRNAFKTIKEKWIMVWKDSFGQNIFGFPLLILDKIKV